MKVKQIFNRLDFKVFVVCILMIFLFIVGCVSFAFASDEKDLAYYQSTCPGNYYLIVKSDHANGTKNCFGGVALKFDETPKRICARLVANGTMSSGYSIFSDVKWTNAYSVSNGWSQSMGSPNDNDSGYYYTGGATAIKNIHEYSSNVVVFETDEDCINYIKTGVINNAIYTPKEEVEYDSDIELPLNLDMQLSGASGLVPNVKITCNQSESVNDRCIEIAYSLGYRASWSLMGGVGLNLKKHTSPVVYGSIAYMPNKYDNSNTSFEVVLPLTDFNKSDSPQESDFKQYEPKPTYAWSLKDIVNQNTEIKIWVRNRVDNKASKWVMVDGDTYTSNFDVVSSDENGNPTDLKDSSANDETGYGSNYWNNKDTTPQEDYSSSNVQSNLKDLKSNYSSLAKFFKELFGFLPAEIWIILIGLVSTMVIIAIVKFVRG